PSSSISPPLPSRNEGNGGPILRSRPPAGSIFSGKFFTGGNNDVVTSPGPAVISRATKSTTTPTAKPPPPTPKGRMTSPSTKAPATATKTHPHPKKVTSFAEVTKR